MTGKPALGDLRRRKKTLPVVVGLSDCAAGSDALSWLVGAQSRATAPDGIAALISAAGGQEAAARRAASHLGQATAIIDGVAVDRAAATRLTDLSRFLLDRSS